MLMIVKIQIHVVILVGILIFNFEVLGDEEAVNVFLDVFICKLKLGWL